MEPEFIQRVKVGCKLGEGIIWNTFHSEFQWTDILSCLLYRYKLGGNVRTLKLPERLCAFGLSDEPDWVIAGFETGFAWLNIETGEVQWIARPELGNTGRRFNDGRVDRFGRFWCGTMVEDSSIAGEETAALYCLSVELDITEAFSGLQICNGCCWSLDGREMFFADSATGKIWRSPLASQSTKINDRSIYAELAEGGAPDGADIDSEGHMWSAVWGAGRIIRLDPKGRQITMVELPTPQPTCVAFGGDDQNLLGVTTANVGLSEPQKQGSEGAGDLFIFRSSVSGVPTEHFGGTRNKT